MLVERKGGLKYSSLSVASSRVPPSLGPDFRTDGVEGKDGSDDTNGTDGADGSDDTNGADGADGGMHIIDGES